MEKKSESGSNLRIKQAKKQAKKAIESGKAPKVYDLIKKTPDDWDEPPKGEQFCVCQKCGETFEQEYSGEQNRYSSFKNCPTCRQRERFKKEKRLEKGQKNISEASLDYVPYPWQEQAHNDFQTHRFQVLACGNRCFAEGTIMSGVYKPIEDVKVGDKVLGNNGKLNRISYSNESEYHGNMYTVKAMGCLPITVTEQHQILVAEVQKNLDHKELNNIIISEKYIAVEKISKNKSLKHGTHTRNYVKIKKPICNVDCNYWDFEPLEKKYKNQINGIPLNEDTAWLFGLYCADGCCLGNSSSKITCNYKQTDLINKAVSILKNNGYSPNLRTREKEGTTCIIISKVQYSRKLDKEMGHGSLCKKIPDSILYNKDEKILTAFLKGYYAGDGSFNSKTGIMQSTTVSVTLALQLQIAFARFGFLASITKSKRQKSRINKKGEVKLSNTEYVISVRNQFALRMLGYNISKKIKEYSFSTPDSVYIEIKDISCEYKDCKVYDLTSADGTLSCCNIIARNSGKDRYTTMEGILYFIECLNENRHLYRPDLEPSVYWWILAPTEKMAKQNWREIKKYFPKPWVVAVSDSTLTMQTVGGGVIEVRSAYDPESLVGVGLDLVTITEAARIKDMQVVWANLEARLSSPGRGLERDKNGKTYGMGKAIINSSPIGKNYFYEMWTWGQKGNSNYSSDWISYQLPWTCNPSNKELAETKIKTKYGEITYEQSLRRRLGDRLYRQNYLADFLASDGTVFKDFEEKCVVNVYDSQFNFNSPERKRYISEWQKPVPYRNYRASWDVATGSSHDIPAFLVRDMETNHIVKIVNLYGKNYDNQYDTIAYWCKYYNNAPCVYSLTGHTAVKGQLSKRGVYEIPTDEQGGRKTQYVQSLVFAVQNEDIKVLYDGTDEANDLIVQMKDYTEENGKFSNKEAEYDDFVSALYLNYYDYEMQVEKVPWIGMMGCV